MLVRLQYVDRNPGIPLGWMKGSTITTFLQQ